MKDVETLLDIGIDSDTDLTFYGLSAKPFQPSADPRCLWLGDKHREGLATLESGIRRNAGLMVVTGDVGTGKTMLTNALIDGLGEDAAVARVWYPSLKPLDFFGVIAGAYHLRAAVVSRETFLAELSEFLTETRRKGREVLLVIDEAQSLSLELFEEIRQLCSLGGSDPKTGPGSALNVLLVGQEELEGVLSRCRGLAQRVALRWIVEPLTADEVGAYIAHRLKVAGSGRNPFSAEAVREVWALSGGIPRIVNALCRRALLTGSRRAAITIGPDIVTQGASRLGTPGPKRERVKRRRKGTPGVQALGGSLPRRAAAIAAGLILLALAVAVAGYLRSPGRDGAAPGGAAARLAAEAARDARSPEPIAEPAKPVAGPAEPAAGVAKPVADLAKPGAEPATPSAKPAKPIPEPATRLSEIATPAGPASASQLKRRQPVISARPVEAVPALPAVPPARSTVKGNAVEERGRAVPELPPPPSKDEVTDVREPPRPLARGGAGERADPDPTAVIDWLLNEYPARRR